MKIFLNQFLLLLAGYLMTVVLLEGMTGGTERLGARPLLLALLVPLLQSLVLVLVTRRNKRGSD